MQIQELSTKHYGSLAAIMLLAPVVVLALKSNDIELSAEEKPYITAFIHFGNYILGSALLGGFFWLCNAFITKNSILIDLSNLLSSLSILMIFIGIYAIIKNTTVQDLISSLHLPGKKQ